MYESLVQSIILYGYKTWLMMAVDLQKLKVFDHYCLCCILYVCWQQFELCSLCTVQNLPLDTSSHEISLLAWSYSVSITGGLHLKINWSSLPLWARGTLWWSVENLALGSEARCEIDLGSTPAWSILLELQVLNAHLIDSFRPLCLVILYLGYSEFFGSTDPEWMPLHLLACTHVYSSWNLVNLLNQMRL